MKLLAISSPEFFPEEADIINSLFREGLECLHIRKPESRADDFAQLLSGIQPDFIGKVSIHQHHELASQFGIKRLHFTENERRKTAQQELNKSIADGYILSTSMHDLDEMETTSMSFSYAFFGPVFDSISKVGYKSSLPDNFFLEDKFKKIPVIGLGGIDASNLQDVRKMNFDGAAVLGVLWKDLSKSLEVFRLLVDSVNPEAIEL